MCDYAGEEFSVMALTETQLNLPGNYTCRTGGSVTASENVALRSNPGAAPVSRTGDVLDDVGEIVRAPSGGGPVTDVSVLDVLRFGARLSPPLPVSEIERDLRGTPRDRSPLRPGVGAYVIPP